MKTKNNNVVVILLTIIILLLVVAVGFLGYKLYLDEDQNNPGNTNQEQNNNTNNDVNDNNDDEDDTVKAMTISDVTKILERDFDSRVVRVTPKVTEKELKTNFKNLDKSNNNYNLVANCKYYNKSEKNCETYSIKVNSTIEYVISLPGCTAREKLYSYNGYLVLIITQGCSGMTEIRIFDKNNNEVYKNENSYSYVYDAEDQDYNDIQVNPTIINNTLYFVEDINDDGKLFLVSIDLSKSTIKSKTIGEFYATHVH